MGKGSDCMSAVTLAAWRSELGVCMLGCIEQMSVILQRAIPPTEKRPVKLITMRALCQFCFSPHTAHLLPPLLPLFPPHPCIFFFHFSFCLFHIRIFIGGERAKSYPKNRIRKVEWKENSRSSISTPTIHKDNLCHKLKHFHIAFIEILDHYFRVSLFCS